MYGLKELDVLIPLEIMARPLYAFLKIAPGNHNGSAIMGYAIDSDGFWLQIHPAYHDDSLTIENWSGYNILGCCHKEIKGYEGNLYGLLPDCKPMLPIPFTAQQLSKFINQTDFISQGIIFDDLMQAHLDKQATSNPKGVELANLIRQGTTPQEDKESDSVNAPLVAGDASGASDASLWKGQAISRANEIIAADKKIDIYQSQKAIADKIANEFRKASPQVLGVGRKPLTGAYIKRHALTGISSMQDKQLSTTTRRSK
jgi:hypothetical protein